MPREQSPALAESGGNKKQWNKMLTARCRDLIKRMAAMRGLDEAGIVEIIVRDAAKEMGLE
jgi:hypothetical protein